MLVNIDNLILRVCELVFFCLTHVLDMPANKHLRLPPISRWAAICEPGIVPLGEGITSVTRT